MYKADSREERAEEAKWELVSILMAGRIMCLDTDAAHAAGQGTAQHWTIDRKTLVNLSITLSVSNQG